MHRFVATVLSALFLTSAPVAAQNLTPENVADAYVEAMAICARAKLAGVGIAQMQADDRARVAESASQMRALVQVPEGRPVWDGLSGRGIVVISEPSDSQCDVTAYGPRVRPVFERVARTLDELGFTETEVQPTASAVLRAFERTAEGRSVQVRFDGGEPGMPGRTFRFPLLLGYVTSSSGVEQ
jgi:hypothetical protein